MIYLYIGVFKRHIISSFHNFPYYRKKKKKTAPSRIIERQTEAWTTSLRGYHMSGGFRVDGVPSLWERRYNLSSADSFLGSLDFAAMKTPSSDVLLPCTASLYRHFHYYSLSLFLLSSLIRRSRSLSLALSLSLPFSFLFHYDRLLFPFLRFRDGTSCRTGIPSDTQNGWLENFIS